MSLRELKLRPTYRKGRNDIAKEFYIPCMSNATSYDRAVGYFNSGVLALAWPALKGFLDREGKIRLITSPALSPHDEQALRDGYSARLQTAVADAFRADVEKLLVNPSLEKPAKLLAALVAMGRVEFKVALLDGHTSQHVRNRLFHDKLGIFRDAADGVVIFKGSMNETWSGLSSDGNLESVDVFVLDGGRETERIRGEIDDFEALWEDRFPSVRVVPFPEVARQELINAADTKNWERLLAEVCTEIELASSMSADVSPGGRTLRAHQARALASWYKAGRRGILEHATGSGKTFTALSAIRDCLHRKEVVLVLVPAEALFDQWKKEIEETLADLRPQLLLCGHGHTDWKGDLLRAWTRPNPRQPRIVLAMLPTASSDDFLEKIQHGDHLAIIADEVHRLGSPQYQRTMSLQSGARLGLSATPRRAGDSTGTQAIFDYFGESLEPRFTLKNAIDAEILVPYSYSVTTVNLTEDEQVRWDTITAKLARAMEEFRRQPNADSAGNLHRLQIERARILKNAEQKVGVALELLRDRVRTGQHWLVYCDNVEQLKDLERGLNSAGFAPFQYYAGMASDRETTLRLYGTNGGILLSIKCLDEGVDIPQISHALILASSQNPREFIQRRGRVLRKADRKPMAHVIDVLVLPHDIDPEEPAISIVGSELSRAILFGRDALNPGVVADLQRVALGAGLDPAAIASGGIEDD